MQRDEILERERRDFQRITLELGRVLEENDPEVGTAIEALVLEAKRSAEEQGPGSEAAQRYRQLQFLAWFGRQAHSHKRRQRPAPGPGPLAHDPSIEVLNQLTAAEQLASPPPGEAVIAIPPDGQDSGRGRVFFRIGLGDASWIGSFELGDMRVSTISMMPDRKHLFVSVEGAGYIIDLKSRTLVETARHRRRRRDGRRAPDGVRRRSQRHEPGSVRKDRPPLENGPPRLRRISSNGAPRRQPRRRSAATAPRRWVGFSVKLATGEVRFEDGR